MNFNELQEDLELLMIKSAFQAVVKSAEMLLKQKAEELGIGVKIKIDVEVESVNLDTFHETMRKID